MTKQLVHLAAAVATCLLGSTSSSQSLVRSSVREWLGQASEGGWYEADGRILAVDSSGLIHDTGITSADSTVYQGHLVVHPGSGVSLVYPDGSADVIPTPAPYEGIAFDGSIRVWRRINHPGCFVLMESDRWDGASWRTKRHQAGSPICSQNIFREVIRPDRYLVFYEEYSRSYVQNLWSGFPAGLSDTGSCIQSWTWSGGAVFCAELRFNPGGNLADGIFFQQDFGSSDYVPFPERWGWGAYAFDIREDFPGKPWAESWRHPEFVPFLLNNRPLPVPGESTHSLFWVRDGALFLADATTAGTRSILSNDGTGWAPVRALQGCDQLSLLLETPDTIALAARDSGNGYKVLSFQPLLGTAETLVNGLATAPSLAVPFACGFLFVADDGRHGSELWFSRGTADSTWMVADLTPGAAGSTPRGISAFRDRAFFIAGPATDSSLYVLEDSELEWRRSPVDGRYYRLTEPAPWAEAERQSRRLGGLLATIRGASEQAWLETTFGGQNAWIGLEDRDGDGTYHWLSGVPLTFANWCPGEPSTSPPGENVVHLAHYPGFCEGGWNNQDPLDSYPGLVERNSPPRAVERYGAGCESDLSCGSFGPSSLTWASGHPGLGADLTLRVDFQIVRDPFAAQASLLLLGADNTSLAGFDLPFDLRALGWPTGCSLLVAPLDAVPLAIDDYGRTDWTATIPRDASLVGSVFHAQAALVDSWPGCSETSNAIRMTISR